MGTAVFEEELIFFASCKVFKTKLWLGDLDKALTALFLLASILAHQQDV